MATASATISLALRKLRVVGLGASPSSAQAAAGLTDLNNLLNHLLGFGASPAFIDVRIDEDYDVSVEYPAIRLLCTHDAAITITLPEALNTPPIRDGFRLAVVDVSAAAATNNITIARNGWKIAGSAANATISTNSANRVYMFRADLGDWKLAADLSSGDDLPFPSDFDLTIALMLAEQMTNYAQRLSETDHNLCQDGKRRLRARYVKPAPLRQEAGVSNIGASPVRPYGRFPWDNDA